MLRQTPLYEVHRQLGGRMVEFAGWELPLHFGSQVEEHRAVRSTAGMFDVSHMGIFDLSGNRTSDFLRSLLANDVGRVGRPGQAIYSCVLNTQGGVLDDLIAYWRDRDGYRLVVNAATCDRDLIWVRKHADDFAVDVTRREDLAILAIQGPEARRIARERLTWLPADADGLDTFEFVEADSCQIARTGYTGEDGYELIIPATMASEVWMALHQGGLVPCGLGARDSLRLEAGLRLYGADMDESVTPLDAGLGWTVAWEPATRDFIGRGALEESRRIGTKSRFVGLILEETGILRAHQRVVVPDAGEGVTTSGGFSPTLSRSIAFARVPAGEAVTCSVEIRGRLKRCRIVSPVFVRRGVPLVSIDQRTH